MPSPGASRPRTIHLTEGGDERRCEFRIVDIVRQADDLPVRGNVHGRLDRRDPPVERLRTDRAPADAADAGRRRDLQYRLWPWDGTRGIQRVLDLIVGPTDES